MRYKHTKLAEFLARENMSQADFAELVGVTQTCVSHWLLQTNRISWSRAKQIEEVTQGRLTRFDLRPDIFSESVASES